MLKDVRRVKNRKYIDFLAKLAVDHAHPGGIGLTETLVSRLLIQSGCRVLDVGCGTGGTAVYLSEKAGARVTGVDLHPVMVEQAKKRASASSVSPRILQGSAEKLPFTSESFDCILSESVTAFTNVKRSLPEYYRVLIPGGQLAAIEMTLNSPLDVQNKQAIKTVYGVDDVRTEEEWITAWKDAGFSGIRSFRANEFQNYSKDSMPTYHLTTKIDDEAIEMWLKHMQTMAQYKDVLSYRIFIMKKPVSAKK